MFKTRTVEEGRNNNNKERRGRKIISNRAKGCCITLSFERSIYDCCWWLPDWIAIAVDWVNGLMVAMLMASWSVVVRQVLLLLFLLEEGGGGKRFVTLACPARSSNVPPTDKTPSEETLASSVWLWHRWPVNCESLSLSLNRFVARSCHTSTRRPGPLISSCLPASILASSPYSCFISFSFWLMVMTFILN